MSQLNGVLESLEWESTFFARPSAIVRLRDDAPALQASDFAAWPRVQAKIPAGRADLLDALQQHGFQLVEGEVDLSITVSRHPSAGAEIASEKDIPALRQMAAQAFAQSRFRAPWYKPEDSGRFYAQWIENAVKGTFDHVCLVFRAVDGPIQGFVSLRKVNEQDAGRAYRLARRTRHGRKTHAGRAALGGAGTVIDAAGGDPDGQHRRA